MFGTCSVVYGARDTLHTVFMCTVVVQDEVIYVYMCTLSGLQEPYFHSQTCFCYSDWCSYTGGSIGLWKAAV